MKILFVMRHSGYVRNFESTLRLLAERGHRVHVALQIGKYWQLDPSDMAQQLSDQYPTFSHGPAPDCEQESWVVVSRELRRGIDYLRYLQPRYRDAPKLRARAERQAPALVLRLAGWTLFRTRLGARALDRALRLLDRAILPRPEIAAFLKHHQPDIVLVTPLVESGAPQLDYFRAARALGMRIGLCVFSWDNLTNKGLIQDVPDLVTVWNAAMKREAVELHGVPPSRVVVTGAAAYDHWFAWQPSTSRAEFCRRVGLPADRPFLLYLCSSKFIALREAAFVQDWLRQLRSSAEPRLREAGVLVRPHPQWARPWLTTDLAGLGDVVVWPLAGAAPTNAASRADYYDSIYHCAAVVGVNTSALIESAIVGRPVHTLLAPQFRETQEGTLHFRHLLGVNGGLLRVASSFEEHATQLAEALGDPTTNAERDRRFLEGFVRPHGLDVAATPKLVAAIEAVGAGPAPRREAYPRWAPLLRLLLIPRVWHVRRRGTEEQRRDRRRRDSIARRGHAPVASPPAPTAAAVEPAVAASEAVPAASSPSWSDQRPST